MGGYQGRGGMGGITHWYFHTSLFLPIADVFCSTLGLFPGQSQVTHQSQVTNPWFPRLPSGSYLFALFFPLLQTLLPHSSSCSTTTTPCSREGAKYSTGLDIRPPPLLPGLKPRLRFPLPRRLETVDNPLWFISPFFRPGIFRQKHPPKNRSKGHWIPVLPVHGPKFYRSIPLVSFFLSLDNFHPII
jgi:hypothetical protein